MLTYTAMYKMIDEGVHAEVLDFPGAISFGADMDDARRMLTSALVDMAETNILLGEPLPTPDPTCTDPDADLEEPIFLMLSAATRVAVVQLREGSIVMALTLPQKRDDLVPVE